MSDLIRTYRREIERNNEKNGTAPEQSPLSPEEIKKRGEKVWASMGIDPSEIGKSKEQDDIIEPQVLREMLKATYEAMQKKGLMESAEESESLGGLTKEQEEAISKQYAASSAPEAPAPEANIVEAEEIGLQEAPATAEKRSFKEILNTPVSDLAKETILKIKQNKKMILGPILIGAAAIALTACGGGGNAPEGSSSQTTPTPQEIDLGQGGEDDKNDEDTKEYTGNPELDKELDGSFEQDDNVGCYEEKDKVTENSVGKPEEILKFGGTDPATATAEQWGEATQFMEYSMKYPAAANAVVFGIKGFEDFKLSDEGIRAAEAKIANMSEEEKAEFLDQLKSINDNAEYKLVTASGVYKNQAVEEPGGRHSEFSDTELEGTILVQKTVKIVGENGEQKGTIIVYYKRDCGNFLTVYQEVQPDGTIKKRTILVREDENKKKPKKDKDPDPSGGGDEKDPAAIQRNMQTGDETTNYVAPEGSGAPSARPDTSSNSYEQETNISAPQPNPAAKNADQGEAGHQTYTTEQIKEQQQQPEAAAGQQAADQTAEQLKPQAVQNEGMSDEEKADWFNNLIKNGNNGS